MTSCNGLYTRHVRLKPSPLLLIHWIWQYFLPTPHIQLIVPPFLFETFTQRNTYLLTECKRYKLQTFCRKFLIRFLLMKPFEKLKKKYIWPLGKNNPKTWVISVTQDVSAPSRCCNQLPWDPLLYLAPLSNRHINALQANYKMSDLRSSQTWLWRVLALCFLKVSYWAYSSTKNM